MGLCFAGMGGGGDGHRFSARVVQVPCFTAGATMKHSILASSQSFLLPVAKDFLLLNPIRSFTGEGSHLAGSTGGPFFRPTCSLPFFGDGRRGK